jgi:hypothetical protein
MMRGQKGNTQKTKHKREEREVRNKNIKREDEEK